MIVYDVYNSRAVEDADAGGFEVGEPQAGLVGFGAYAKVGVVEEVARWCVGGPELKGVFPEGGCLACLDVVDGGGVSVCGGERVCGGRGVCGDRGARDVLGGRESVWRASRFWREERPVRVAYGPLEEMSGGGLSLLFAFRGELLCGFRDLGRDIAVFGE